MNSGAQEQTPLPGQTLAAIVRPWSQDEGLAFVALLEQKARRVADLEMLREIKAFRQISTPKQPGA